MQAFLGVVCFVSLVGKRFTDKIRRPWKIWFLDTSKQGFSAFLVHFLNILLSMAFGEWLDADADPCNWYWINLTLDDTLGVGILFLLLKVLQCTYRTKCVGRPELALSGEYGEPPDVRIFGRQFLDWQGLVILQKAFFAVMVVKYTEQVAAVAAFLLGWLDSFPRVKLVVVMVVTPLTMNVFALWMADSFLQADPRNTDIEEGESLVCMGSGSNIPSAVGRRRGGPQRHLAVEQEDNSDESEGVLSFQEWKQGKAARRDKQAGGAAKSARIAPRHHQRDIRKQS